MHVRRRGELAAVAAIAVALSPHNATAAITPSPYNTRAATGTVTVATIYGTSRCLLSGVGVQATSTATGARGTVTTFPSATCPSRAFVTGIAYLGPITFAVDRGAVTVSYLARTTTVIGRCQYGGTLTGTIANGASSAAVSGRPGLITTELGVCEPGYPTTLTLDLPGAAITW